MYFVQRIYLHKKYFYKKVFSYNSSGLNFEKHFYKNVYFYEFWDRFLRKYNLFIYTLIYIFIYIIYANIFIKEYFLKKSFVFYFYSLNIRKHLDKNIFLYII